MQAIEELVQLLRQRTWDKELLLWSGPEAKLLPALTGLQAETLDLLDLFDPAQLPIDDDEIRLHLCRSLRRRLQAVDRAPGKRTVLIVRSAGLLARYRAGVREFYEWFCDDFSMVILLVEGPYADEDWPDEVDGKSDRLIDYFMDPGMIKRQFGA
ncbi:MAG: hypothetical protein NTY19_04090 [Planctomycetota bacterium]|nr:hypothetical protein [Planctomycetota bacterium]